MTKSNRNTLIDYILQFKFFLSLIIIGLILYSNTAFNDFVWDDFDQVVRNTAVHFITNIQYFFSGSTFYSGGGERLIGLYYKPLMPMFFAFIYSLAGPTPAIFHLFQVLLHIANAVLLLIFLNRIFKDWVAILASLLFLIHPINSESVVYISALQDTLYFFFGIISLLIIQMKNKRVHLYILLFISMLATILSKETGLLFILISTVYSFLYHRQEFKKILLIALATLACYALLRFGIAQVFYQPIGLAPIIRAPLETRLLTIPKIVFYYLSTFFWPLNLAISQHWLVKTPSLGGFFLPLVIDSAVLFGLVNLGLIIYKRNQELFKALVLFSTWLILGMGLNSNLIPLDMTVADRWFYFPSVGLIGLLSILASLAKINNQYWKFNLLMILLIILSLYGLRTFIRTFDWRDITTLYGHDIKINRDSFDLENNYGVALYRAGKYDEAATYFQRSIELAPYWYTSWHNIGLIYERDKKIESAREAYQKTIELSGGAYFGYISLARLNLMYGEAKEAEAIVQQALKRYPKNSELWLLLALSEHRLNNKDAATQAAQQAFNLSRGSKEAFVLESLAKDQPIDLNKIYFFK